MQKTPLSIFLAINYATTVLLLAQPLASDAFQAAVPLHRSSVQADTSLLSHEKPLYHKATHHRSHAQMTRLNLGMASGDFHDDGEEFCDDDLDDDDLDISFFDAEAARRRFESLVAAGPDGPAPQGSSPTPEGTSGKSSPNVSARIPVPSATPSYSDLPAPPVLDVVMPPRPPITMMDRVRRHREMELLAQLAVSDDALPDLWSLWFAERGEKAARLLHEADDLMNDEAAGPSAMIRAATILVDLIKEHGVYFVEPVHRLATLHYLQGNYNEAEDLFKMVLSAKPWHFGSLSGIVMVYERQGKAERARQWATRRLPAFMQSGSSRRRSRWTERALLDAQEALEAAEQAVVDLFGAPDRHTDHIDDNIINKDDDDAWQ